MAVGSRPSCTTPTRDGAPAARPTAVRRGARSLSLAPGRLMQPELLAEIGEGLLVQSVNGLHSGVNPVSGDFSVGAEGMLVRGGVPVEPVREATIASTLQRM